MEAFRLAGQSSLCGPDIGGVDPTVDTIKPRMMHQARQWEISAPCYARLD
jgi:hypothetical protein